MKSKDFEAFGRVAAAIIKEHDSCKGPAHFEGVEPFAYSFNRLGEIAYTMELIEDDGE